MNVRGHVIHDPNCQTPMSEHSGSESCLTYELEQEEHFEPTLMKQTPRGMVVDHHAMYVRDYGHATGEIRSTAVDRRDMRDPTEVGLEWLARRNGG